ncbi:MAG: hypothetical protein JEZ10_04425 [Verrucomicrobia bacterium]|nr:hypothetical protein [Verrucomicrobiota bacterium]
MKKQFNILMAAVLLGGGVSATVLNEWTFETDPAALTLSVATNSGSDGAAFSVDNNTVTQTDGSGGLVCDYAAAGSGGLWTDGAVLAADVAPSAPGETRYLRYDVAYDMTSPSIDSGTLLGFAFADNVNSDLAGFALRYRVGNPVPPAGVTEQVVKANLNLTGTIAVIAEVNLTAQTLKVWYDLSGSNTFDYDIPDATVSNLSLSAIDQLEFRATGDFIAGSSECAVVDELRTATLWDEIAGPPADATQPPVPEIIEFDDQMGGAMLPGQTNTLRVVIRNTLSAAANVTSTLSFDGVPGDFTIVSNNAPVALDANRIVTNTYQIVSLLPGNFLFTALAFSDGTPSDPAELIIRSGTSISAGLVAITNEIGGVLPGRPEPGEVFDLIISNINDGGLLLTDVTNSLSANPDWFPSITPSTIVFPTLDVGEVATVTYRVECAPNTPGGPQTFTIVNRTADEVWQDTFQLDVYRSSVLTGPSELVINAVPGETVFGTITLTNEGNVSSSFSVTDDDTLIGSYAVTTQTIARTWIGPSDFDPDTTFPGWNGTDSDPVEIGFGFELFGAKFHTFSANQAGFLTLMSTNGAMAQLTVFESGDKLDQSTIRYIRRDDGSLVVAWGNTYPNQLDVLEFQAVLHPDGTVQYLYEYGDWEDGEIGLSSEPYAQNVSHTPGLYGQDALELTPLTWIFYDPETGTVDPYGGTVDISVTANVPDPVNETNKTTLTIVGDDNQLVVDVKIIIQEKIAKLHLASSFSFGGPAGSISPPAMLTMTNSGNISFDFDVQNLGLAESGYSFDSVGYQWVSIPGGEGELLDGDDFGTAPVEIGFPFVFFGSTYDSLFVYEDGRVLFKADTGFAVYYVEGLALDGNASVRAWRDESQGRFVVIWRNMSQPDGGDDQTFQLVLTEGNSTLRCNYQRLDEGWPSGQIGTFSEFGTSPGTLVNDDTTELVVTETIVYEYVTNRIGNVYIVDEVPVATNREVELVYDDTLRRQSLLFAPGEEGLITYSPEEGVVLPGETTDISLAGDGRTLEAGDEIKTQLLFLNPDLSEDISFGSPDPLWTQSATLHEYYLTTPSGGNPGILKPDSVIVISNDGRNGNGEGTVGSLGWFGWGWGRNPADPIGFDTLYVYRADISQSIVRSPYSKVVDVTFTVSAPPAAAAADPVVVAAMWGSDDPVVSFSGSADGSRTLSWPAPTDRLSRTYTVWFTTRLGDEWQPLAMVKNGTSYVDDEHNNEPVIFYKVTVQ